MSYYPEDLRQPTRHGFVLVGIVLLHLLTVAALWGGLGSSRVRYVQTGLTIDVLPAKRAKEPPPRQPPVNLTESSVIQVATPEIDFPVGTDLTPQVQGAQVEQDLPSAPILSAPPSAPAVPDVKPRPLHVPGGQDRYPAESRRARESGEPTITICISATGSVDSVQVYESSGFPRLDQAAVGIGKESIFKPAKLDRKPVPFCLPYRIKFKFGSS